MSDNPNPKNPGVAVPDPAKLTFPPQPAATPREGVIAPIEIGPRGTPPTPTPPSPPGSWPRGGR